MKTIKLTEEVLAVTRDAIRTAIAYQKLTGRKLGITGEVAEVLVAEKLKLDLLADPIYPGCDAVDSEGKRYQIKARRSKNFRSGRMGRISEHPYDFLVLALIDPDYNVRELYRLPHEEAEVIANLDPRRSPPVQRMARSEWAVEI